MYTPVPALAEAIAVGGSSAPFDLEMSGGAFYLFTSDVACWIAQGEDPTATAGPGSMHVGAGRDVKIAGTNGAKLAVIRAGDEGGMASLAPLQSW